MNAIRIKLTAATRSISIDLLNGIVADLVELYTRARQAYWRARDHSFLALHRQLDELIATIGESIDFLADRAKSLGGAIEGRLRDLAQPSGLARLDEPAVKASQRDWIRELAEVHATCGRQIQRAIKTVSEADDFGTAYLLTGALRDLDHQLRSLEAHFEKT